MNLIYVLGIALLFSFFGEKKKCDLELLREWVQNPSEELGTVGFSGEELSKKEAADAVHLVAAAAKKQAADSYRKAWEQKIFNRNQIKMPFDYRVFGEKPADGRSLYISMHGGGNTAPSMNDRQWYNQVRLYKPEEGVYIAPRAPWDDWNMWFKPGLDEFFEDLIGAAVALMGVNPDKVYVLGYSAGGDGVWRMAPRMADRWAAASMMAGHPGEASQVSLLNLPFMIWMGENDGAYNRNRLAAEKGLIMDSLRAAEPRGYIHETHIVAGKGHWMDQADTVAVSWMAQYQRNPYPEKVVWRQEQVVRPSLYWLEVNREEGKHGMEAIVERKGNTFVVLKNDYKQLTLALNDEMIDFKRPVEVVCNGKKIFSGKVKRNMKDISYSVQQRRDERLIFSSRLTIHNNQKVK